MAEPTQPPGGEHLAEGLSAHGGSPLACTIVPVPPIQEGALVVLRASVCDNERTYCYHWCVTGPGGYVQDFPTGEDMAQVTWNTTGVPPGCYTARVTATAASTDASRSGTSFVCSTEVNVLPRHAGDVVRVALQRSANRVTSDVPLWEVIRRSARALSFDHYYAFIDGLLCGPGRPHPEKAYPSPEPAKFDSLLERRFLPFNDADAYRLLKVATEAFVVVNCGVAGLSELCGLTFNDEEAAEVLQRIDAGGLTRQGLNDLWQSGLHDARIPGVDDNGPALPVKTLLYLKLIRDKLPDVRIKLGDFAAREVEQHADRCFGILREKLVRPCLLELIWSYWQEEGMLVQTMNAISLRFQNIRGPGENNPLAFLEIGPLRPLSNLLWGYVQDEQHRLSLVRRAVEYEHHYGFTLQGKAVPRLRPADSRSKFLEAFHNLLYLTAIFYKEDDDTTVKADGFPVLNALREVHFLLVEGAHNQFGDLPATARQEMLVQQWLLARPEFREFLPTRLSVDYPEPWMDRVDAMKHLQGWTDVSVYHFNQLAVCGEQILLSVRFGDWSRVVDPAHAANWARSWRGEVQAYLHAYRAATGVDVTAEVTDARQAALRNLQPGLHLARRLGGRPGGQGRLPPAPGGFRQQAPAPIARPTSPRPKD
jgi:hypothetical protein